MSITARLLRVTAVAATAAIAASILLPAAEAAPRTLKGTVTWTTTVALNLDKSDEFGFGDLKTGTTTWTVGMKIKLAKANGTSMADVGSSYAGTFNDNRTTQERNLDGVVQCTTTSVGTGKAGGKLPKRPKSTNPPALFSTLIGSKAITLTPILRYKGTQTTTFVGSGVSPCQSGEYTDPIDGSLAPTYSSEWICYPKGTNKNMIMASAGTVVGAWSASKKGYTFDCTNTWKSGDGETITTRIKGLLK